jgi:MSHA biogenesis protein MshP
MRQQRGMSIVVALLVVVVVAMLAAFAVTVGGAQRQSGETTLQINRAVAAARVGIEWAAYRARNGFCNAAPAGQSFALTEGALRGFQVTVWCSAHSHTEGALPPYSSYDISVKASYGTVGSTDFTSRTLTARYYSPGF